MFPIRIKACSESDLRMLGDLARNIQRVLPVTQADIDAAAALGKGWVVWKVIEVNDPLDNLRGGTQLVIKQNSITPGQNVRRVLIVSGPGGETVVIGPGPSPLLLPDAVVNSLQYVKAFGGTKQTNLPMGYTQVAYVYFLANSYLTTDINPTYDGRYEFDFQTTTLGTGGATTYLGVRPTSTGNGGLRIARISSQVFRIYGFGAYKDSTTTAAANTRYKFVWNNQHAVMTSGGNTVLDLTFTGTEACAYPITINGWNSAGTVTVGAEGIFVYSFKAWNAQGELVADYVPTKDPDGVVGFYDTVSETFKTATGGTIAAGPDATPIPTPDAPVDIVSNNGVIAFRDTELPPAYRRILGMTMDNDCYYEITGFKMNGSDTLRFSFTRTGANACNVLGAYDGTSAQSNYSLYAGGTSSASYLRYNGGTYNSYAVADKKYNVVITPTGSDGMENDSTWTAKTFTSTTNLCIGTTSPSATSSKMVGSIHGSVVVDSRLELIPCERISDGELGYYDTYTDTFYEPIGTTPTSLGYDYTKCGIVAAGPVETINAHGKNLNGGGALDHQGYTSTGGTSTSSTFCGTLWKIKVNPGEKYTISYGNFPDGVSGVFINTWLTDGTWNLRQAIAISGAYTYTVPAGVGEVNFTLYKTGGITIADNSWLQVEKGETATDYEPYYDGGTATAEMLLKIDNYQDVQSILDGVVTRNVGVLVLDGTEDWSYTSDCFQIFIDGKSVGTPIPISTHFISATGTGTNRIPDKGIGCSNSNTRTWLRYDIYQGDVTQFKQFLADQYAAGTPVIVVYPLAEPITESVTGQTLQVTDGDNTLEITQASLPGLELEAEYTKVA